MSNALQKILTVVGARPQFVKAAMVSRAIKEHNSQVAVGSSTGIKELMLHTGQHYDDNMSRIFFDHLGIPEPKYNLNIGSGKHGETTGRMLAGVEQVILDEHPDWVLVYGDTNSTLAGALAAAKLHVPVAHVEAGLRSFNRKMPEEINRILTDHVADLLLCPTKTAVRNLSNEGITKAVHHVGDVMFDAALVFGAIAEERSTILEDKGLEANNYCLATVHRAENVDDDRKLASLVAALSELARKDGPLVLPLHPRTRSALNRIGYPFPKVSNEGDIRFIDPVSFLDMIMLEKNAKLVLTDSGGVQKEAFFHEVPCITLRDETEWVETIEAGWNQLAGTDKDNIVNATLRASKGSPIFEYGKGQASKGIIRLILGYSE